MDSSDDKGRRRSNHSDEENPLIALRRFADEQMASLLDNFPLFGPFSSPNSQSSSSRWRPHDEEARRQAMDSWGGHPQHEGRWGPGSPPAWRTSWRGQRSDRKTSSEVDIPVRKYQEPQRAASSEDKPLRCPYRPDGSDYNEPSTPPPSTRNLEDRDPWQFIAMDFALPGSLPRSIPGLRLPT